MEDKLNTIETFDNNFFFQVTIQLEVINDKGKIQKKKENYIVLAKDPKEAQDIFTQYMKDIVIDYEFLTIKKTNVISVIYDFLTTKKTNVISDMQK